MSNGKWRRQREVMLRKSPEVAFRDRKPVEQPEGVYPIATTPQGLRRAYDRAIHARRLAEEREIVRRGLQGFIRSLRVGTTLKVASIIYNDGIFGRQVSADRLGKWLKGYGLWEEWKTIRYTARSTSTRERLEATQGGCRFAGVYWRPRLKRWVALPRHPVTRALVHLGFYPYATFAHKAIERWRLTVQ